MTMKHLINPFGEYTLSSDFIEREEVILHKTNVNTRLLETPYPMKNPLFGLLPNQIEVQKTLPDWWVKMVATCPSPLQFLLMSVKADEFYSGTIDEKRAKLFRSMLSDEQKRQIPASPKIGGLLSSNSKTDAFSSKFDTRGDKSSVSLAHITCNPEDIFYMSNGAGWRSCQHFGDGGYGSRLAGSMRDVNLAMIYVLKDESKGINWFEKTGQSYSPFYDGNVLCRTLIRLVRFSLDDGYAPFIVTDRSYGNSVETSLAMIEGLISAVKKSPLNIGSLLSGTIPDSDITAFPIQALTSIVKPSYQEWGYQDNMSVNTALTQVIKRTKYDFARLDGFMYTTSINEWKRA